MSYIYMYIKSLIDYSSLFLDLIKLIHRSSTPNPEVELLTGIFDFKRWIQPYLAVMGQHSW